MNDKKEKQATQQKALPVVNTATPSRPPQLLKIPRKFEIFIEEMNERDDGQVEWRPVNMGHEAGKPIVITVNSPDELKDLQNQYKMAGQRFTIVREIDKPTPADIQRMAQQQGIALPPPPKAPTPPQAQIAQQAPVQAQQIPVQQQAMPPVQAAKPKPKYVTIGDVQLKYDGDKVYQKQWIRLNSNESANFRIVNDSNNKIFPLNGKHVEVKKWVLVEEQSDENSTEEEFNEQV